VRAMSPQAPAIAPGRKLFALRAADGTPIMVTDSREAAVANAWSHELQTVSVRRVFCAVLRWRAVAARPGCVTSDSCSHRPWAPGQR
jgi:hypothetical protein